MSTGNLSLSCSPYAHFVASKTPFPLRERSQSPVNTIAQLTGNFYYLGRNSHALEIICRLVCNMFCSLVWDVYIVFHQQTTEGG
jgi:hypothetical protein